MPKPFISLALIYQGIFVLTGICQTLGNQVLHYQGAGDKRTMLPTLALFLGTTLTFFLPKKKSETPVVDCKTSTALFISLMEVTGSVTGFAGLTYAGSGLYSVVYSSIGILSAILSRIILNRELNWKQWAAVIVVSLGLSLSIYGVADTPLNGTQIFGVLITLLGTFIYSCNYVFIEKTLQTNISSQSLQYTSGAISVLLILSYVVFYTFPNWDSLLTQNIAASNGDLPTIILAFIGIIVASFGHTWSFYKLLVEVGSVSTGILQALRAVIVFFLSSFLFCSVHHEQCLTNEKVVAAIIVVGGTIFYNLNTNTNSQVVEKLEEKPIVQV